MSSFTKYVLVVSTFVVISLFFANWMREKYPPELIQLSIADKKTKASQTKIVDLFSDMGITPPSHGFVNPCRDAEEYSLKFCSPIILSHVTQAHVNCEKVANDIGRACQEQNFEKLFNHFILKK